MPTPTPRKVAGKVRTPPSQSQFDNLPLRKYCLSETGIYRRLHVIDPATGDPWPAIFFSKQGRTRFDPAGGAGTMCVGTSLGGAMLEKFDDSWGPVGDPSRSLTDTQLRETWETLIYLPPVELFDATGGNPSKIGIDGQIATGEYTTTRNWALLMMLHPAAINGILFPSRHDLQRRNVALFDPGPLMPSIYDATLTIENIDTWTPKPAEAGNIVWGPAQLLLDHPELDWTVTDLEVAITP